MVVEFKVTSKVNDIGELDNMALRAKRLFNTGKLEVLADKGYCTANDQVFYFFVIITYPQFFCARFFLMV